MMVIYTPAFIASALLFALGHHGIDQLGMLPIPLPSLAAVFCIIHFAKRCLEVLFLHKYSGRTDRATPSQISVYYTLMAVMISYAAGRKENRDHEFNTTMISIGTLLFAIGIAGNFYHHYLLATLRSSNSSNNKNRYVAPKGG